MYTMRRWWDRHGLQVVLVIVTISTGWFIRETQGAIIYEIYQSIFRPFQGKITPQEKIENARIQELQQRLTELESQNQKLKELLNYTKADNKAEKKPGIVAQIIGRSTDHWWKQLILGRGSKDGIKEGFIVMGQGGLVGRVTHVTDHTSRVLLISDPKSQVGVVISRSRNMGYMRGQNSNRAVMRFFDKVPDVRKGDVIATSSVSQLFPSSLPIGRIESVNLNKSPAPEAIIELTAPIMYLEWVIVQPKPENIK